MATNTSSDRIPLASAAVRFPPIAYSHRQNTDSSFKKIKTAYSRTSANTTTGIFRIIPCPRNIYALWVILIEAAFPTSMVSPRPTDIIASVTMNAMIWNLPIMMPLSSPNIAAQSKVAAKDRGRLPVVVRTFAPTMPLTAMFDPTDRSIPPVRMMNVIPTETIVRTPICRNMFIRFESFKNAGLTAPKITNRTTTIANRVRYRTFRAIICEKG